MNQNTQQLALALFIVILPGSVYCCAVGFIAAGFLRDSAEQRSIFPLAPLNNFFRFAAKVAGTLRAGPSPSLLLFAAVGIAFCNFTPVFVLVRNPYGGSGSVVAVLVYFLVHSVWLAVVARSIVRSRTSRRSSSGREMDER